MYKRTLIGTLAWLALFLAVSAGAQSPAPSPLSDVPSDHWAYQAVDTLQRAGIVIGYPDGTYGGRRAMTRYEFAEAIARLLPLLNPPANLSSLATKDDLAALRQDLEDKLAGSADAITALQKLVGEFQPELASMGQDVAGAKERLNSLEARVAAVEEEQRRIKFTGVLTTIARADSLTKGPYFMDSNGITDDATKHLLNSTDVYEDFVLGIKGKLSESATANVKIDFGNYLSAVGNTAARGYPLSDTVFNPNTSATLWEANIDTPISLGPLGGADLVAGRFGNEWTRYTLRQADADVYTSLAQLDDGKVITDGAKVNLEIGPVDFHTWAGKLDTTPFSQLYAGPVDIGSSQLGKYPGGLIFMDHAASLDQGAGIRATIGQVHIPTHREHRFQFIVNTDSNR